MKKFLGLVVFAVCFAQSVFAAKIWPETFIPIVEQAGILRGDYAVSNEHDFFLLEELLNQNQGVVLSIGSLRGLLVAAKNPISSPIVMIDYDKAADAVNAAFIKTLAMVTDRFEMIEQLTNRHDETLLAKVRAGEISEALFVEKLFKLPYSKDLFFAEYFQKFSDLSWEQNQGVDSTAFRLDMLFFLTDLLKSSSRWKASFFGSDLRFGHLKKAQAGGLLLNVLTDMANPSFLASLSVALGAKKQKLALIDFSNVLDHMLGEGIDVEKFVKNLSELPFTANARFAISLQDFPKKGQEWSYFSAPMSILFQANRLGLFKDFKGYLSFLKQIKASTPNKVLHSVSDTFSVTALKPTFVQSCLSILRLY